MSWLTDITPDNFNASFNIENILNSSVFYPDAGLDATDIERVSKDLFSFAHSDEQATDDDVRQAMTAHFTPVQYNLIGIQKMQLAQFKFALWAVYSLKPNAAPYSDGTKKRDRFSLLHVCSSGEIAFTYLYEMNNIKPIECFNKPRI